jgi:hypothetical protein
MRSQASRHNNRNHPELRPVFVVRAVEFGKTFKKGLARLELCGEDGDGRIKCVFWRDEAERAAHLVKVGDVVTCATSRCHADDNVVVCEGCRALRKEWRDGAAAPVRAAARRCVEWARSARPAKRQKKPPPGSYASPLPLGEAVARGRAAWTRAAVRVAQLCIDTGEDDVAVGRLLRMMLDGNAPLVLRLSDGATTCDCPATPQLARALHGCLTALDVETADAHAAIAGKRYRRLQAGFPPVSCELLAGSLVRLALLREDAAWTPMSECC